MTHHINILDNSTDIVLNLSGGSLPRKDRGNTEEYCMAMLTFFQALEVTFKIESS